MEKTEKDRFKYGLHSGERDVDKKKFTNYCLNMYRDNGWKN